MGKTRWTFIVALGLIGLIFFGQGVGAIGGSYMTGMPLWAGIGAAMVLVAIVLAAARRRRN